MAPDPLRIARDRQGRAADALTRRPPAGATAYPAVVARVVTPAPQAGRYARVRPVAVLGAEQPGAIGSLAPDPSRTFLAFIPGPHAPAAGDDLICRFVGDRWVAEPAADAGAGDPVVVAGCPCASSPRVLRMSSSAPLSNNRIFRDATIVYQPIPAPYAALGLGSQGYISDQEFDDQSTGDLFRYYLNCFQSFYLLTRIYAVSAFGSPYRDNVLYRWLVGLAGNSCQPFLLSNGVIFPGGDASCVVTISE